jgi:uncharacterized membrane protein YphA (DoxX/SURF4 family)
MTTFTAALTAAPARLSRPANILLWVVQIPVALSFTAASVTKFIAYPPAVESFDTIGFGSWFMYFIATVELAGAAGLLIPRLTGLAALGLTALLVGAIVTQLVFFTPASALTPAAYLVPVAVIAWFRRPGKR